MDLAELERISAHGHSDLESNLDEDPYFEYNKCNQTSRLETKVGLLQKIKFHDIAIQRFSTKRKTEDAVEVNIADEIHRLVSNKYLAAMDNLVAPQNIIDESELKALDSYCWRNRHLLDNSGIPNYEECWKPLPHNYFDKDRTASSAQKRVTPLLSSAQY